LLRGDTSRGAVIEAAEGGALKNRRAQIFGIDERPSACFCLRQKRNVWRAWRRVYCEAESADSWPALVAVLTDGRIPRLHALGFADRGRSQNYSKTYKAKDTKDADLARDVLTILHDV
jgi:hypothetical protein